MKTACLLPNAAGQTQGLLLERAAFFPEVPKMPFVVRCVTTVEDFIEFIVMLGYQKWFSFDTETTDINPRRALLVGMSFCWEPDEAWYIPVQCPIDEHCLTINYVLENVAPYLENIEYKKLGQNLKYDKIVLRNHNIDLRGISFDTLIASYLLDAGSRRHNLDILAKKYLNHTTIKLSELIGTGKNQLSTKDVPLECMAAYAAEDAWVVAQIAPMLYAEAERQKLTNLLDRVEIPLVSVLADMEYNGIKADLEKADALQRDFESRIAKSLDSIRERAGDRFNPNSLAQLREELFGRLLLPSNKNTPGGECSTDKSVLNELAKQHDLPKAITEYRELTKLNGTYVSSLPGIVFPD
jgi:DNA polymerase-1